MLLCDTDSGNKFQIFGQMGALPFQTLENQHVFHAAFSIERGEPLGIDDAPHEN